MKHVAVAHGTPSERPRVRWTALNPEQCAVAVATLRDCQHLSLGVHEMSVVPARGAMQRTALGEPSHTVLTSPSAALSADAREVLCCTGDHGGLVNRVLPVVLGRGQTKRPYAEHQGR